MVTRILTAIVALLALIPILIWGGVWGVGALFALLSGFCVYELLCCCDLFKKWYISVPCIVGTVGCILMTVFFRRRIILDVSALLFIIPVVLVYFLVIAVIKHKTIDVERLMMCFALVVYITAGFTSLTVLYVIRPLFGLWAVTLVLAIAWATDTFAYFSGMLFGKKKLCPEISPKKTIAGAIGGTLFGTLAGMLVFGIAHGQPLWGLIALPLSIISQLGDLAASVIKRRFGVKDYGKIFPGHGGVLDRFDSIIPTAIMTTVALIAIVVVSNIIKFGFFGI